MDVVCAKPLFCFEFWTGTWWIKCAIKGQVGWRAANVWYIRDVTGRYTVRCWHVTAYNRVVAGDMAGHSASKETDSNRLVEKTGTPHEKHVKSILLFGLVYGRNTSCSWYVTTYYSRHIGYSLDPSHIALHRHHTGNQHYVVVYLIVKGLGLTVRWFQNKNIK